MTGGWAATNTLRDFLIQRRWFGNDDEQDAAVDAHALVEAALDAAERYIERGGVPEHDALAAALRAVREGK